MTENEYIRDEFNNLVPYCDRYGYQINIHDGYGNKTKYLKITADQLHQIMEVILHKQIDMNVTEEQIAEKLRQVEEHEAKFGECLTSRAWRKWCTDEQYRQREQRFRNAIANSLTRTT